MNLKWYYNRWNHFDHPFEVFYRTKSFLWNRIADPFFLRKFASSIKKELVVNKSSFVYTKRRGIGEAKKVFNYSFYNISLNLNDKIKWRYDYKNHITSPLKLSTRINKNDFNEVGELKIAMEPSRFTFLPSFTYYFLQLNEKEKAYSPIQHIIDWNDENPFLRSFNWSDGIEVGIRSINLTLTILLIYDLDKKLFDEHQELFSELVIKHDCFLRNHLSLFSSANNHLVAELAGLITLNSAFNLNNKNRALKYYRLLSKVTSQQFFRDGFSREQSTHYFKDVLSLYSIIFSMIKRFKITANQNYIKDILVKSKHFYEHLRINSNRYFDMGDNDNSVIIDNLLDRSFNEYESVRTDLLVINNEKPYNDEYDFRNYLLWGNIKRKEYDNLLQSNEKENELHYYSHSKYVLYHKNDTHILIDYSDLGYKFLGAHGHSDLMSFQLVVSNTPIFIDPGTFQYHSKYIKERNYFRSISAHNSLSLDGHNHAEITSNMMWNKITKPYNVIYKKESDGFSMGGIFCFPGNKTHFRTYMFMESTNELLITDELNAHDETAFVLFFQINPNCRVEKDVRATKYTIYNDNINCVNLDIKGSNLDFDLVTGSRVPYLGWYSDNYDSIQKGKTLIVKGKFKNNKIIHSRIKINKDYNEY